MAIEFKIDGLLELTFINPITKDDVTENVEKEILSNLQNGTYVIGLASKTVKAIEDFQTVLYEFEIDVTDHVEYDFDEL